MRIQATPLIHNRIQPCYDHTRGSYNRIQHGNNCTTLHNDCMQSVQDLTRPEDPCLLIPAHVNPASTRLEAGCYWDTIEHPEQPEHVPMHEMKDTNVLLAADDLQPKSSQSFQPSSNY